MKTLPLYPTDPQSAVGTSEQLARDPACARCNLHERKRTVCMFADGDPGGLVVVSDYPGRTEDAAGRPMVGDTGSYLRALIRKLWTGPVVYTNALSCAAGDPKKLKEPHADACRPYLAATVADMNPSRILALGGWAAYGVLGRKPPVQSVRRGYGWHTRPDGVTVPVFLGVNPVNALRGGRWVARQFESDLAWALTANPRPAFRVVTNMVETPDDARAACAALRSGCTFDVETSGVMHEPGFRVEAVSLWDDLDGYTWDRVALEHLGCAEPLRALLADPAVEKVATNGKYDCLSSECDAAVLGVRVANVSVDVRLIRKLLEPGVSGELEDMAELVGLGGHKAEAQDALAVIERDLAALAKEPFLKPLKPDKHGNPRVRPPYQPKAVDRDHVDPRHLASMRTGYRVKAFSQRYLDPTIRARYNARDTYSTSELRNLVAPQLSARPALRRVWDEIVRPASWATVAMERAGVAVDRAALAFFTDYLEIKITAAREAMSQYTPPGFNPNSPPQVSELLFGKLGLPMLGGLTESEEQGATGKEVLEELADLHPFPALLREFRRLDKLRGTYADGMAPRVLSTGRIHPSWLLDGAECLPAGELVMTARGYIPAENVHVGDRVLAHTGVERSVVATSVNAPTAIYRVETHTCHTLRTTGNHQYLLTDGTWRRADALRAGDTVVVHSGPEEWRGVCGWESFEVSSWGRVRNSRTGRVLALQKKGKWGHLKVTLTRNGARRRGCDIRDFPIHRLVQAAFGDGSGKEVRHLNGIAWDNTATNLAWGSALENRRDAVRHGTMSKRRAGRTRLTEQDVVCIRATPRPPHGGAGRWATAGVSDAKLAVRYGVRRETIRDIRSGKRWLPEVAIEGKHARFGWATVARVVCEPAEVTYGCTVDVDHSHVTGGMVTHNTGRASCKEPNLQNIPRNEDDEGHTEGKMARDIFVAPRGKLLVSCDYSQLELRVAAMISRDAVMLALFESGVDFHTATAERICEVAWKISRAQWDALTKEQRKPYRATSKTVNFAVHYGKGAKQLAKQIGGGCTAAQAQRVVDAILGEFARLKACMAEHLLACRREGGAWTYWRGERARFRPLPAIADRDEGRRGNAERSAWNSPVQGTAAEYATASLWPVVQRFERERIPARLLLTVHDALIAECETAAVAECAGVMVEEMQRHWSGGVPLVVDTDVGPSWGSLEPYKVAA